MAHVEVRKQLVEFMHSFVLYHVGPWKTVRILSLAVSFLLSPKSPQRVWYYCTCFCIIYGGHSHVMAHMCKVWGQLCEISCLLPCWHVFQGGHTWVTRFVQQVFLLLPNLRSSSQRTWKYVRQCQPLISPKDGKLRFWPHGYPGGREPACPITFLSSTKNVKCKNIP